jgi:dephospho-CoA kinase
MGAGKSECSRILSEEGYRVIDGDSEAKKVMMADPDIRRRIAETFGAETVDENGIDFRKLGAVAFSTPERLRELDTIVHPPLLRHLHGMVHEQDTTLIALDAALIPLWRIEAWFDLLLWVTTSFEIRLQRLKAARPDLAEAAIVRRMQRQEQEFSVPPETNWRYLDNSGDLLLLGMRIRSLLAELQRPDIAVVD